MFEFSMRFRRPLESRNTNSHRTRK